MSIRLAKSLAAVIEPAPQVGVTADEPGRWLSGEDGQKAPLVATATPRAKVHALSGGMA